MGEGLGGWTKKVDGFRSTNWLLQNIHGDVKDSIQNTVAKEYIIHADPWKWTTV